jgi:PAS domain S-box-containing protein
VYEKLSEAIASGMGCKGEFRGSSNGEARWELASISPIRNSEGVITHFLTVEEDVTEKKRAVEALRESEERYRSLYKNTPAMLHSIDRDGRILSVSENWLSVLGYRAVEVLGRRLTDFMTEESKRYAFEVGLPEFFDAGLCRDVSYQFVKSNGEVLDVLVSAISESGPYGELDRSLAVVFDVTERKRAEEGMREAHDELHKAYESLEKAQSKAISSAKLAAVGRLTAGVSHEILNPLNIITLRLYMLINNADVSHKVLTDLRTLEEQANRITKIAQDLLSFSRQRTPERIELDLNDTVRRTVELVGHDLRLQDIAVQMELAEGLPHVLADQNQLQQVVLNLVTNARDVMPDGGQLILSTQVAYTNESKFVEFRVEDTGAGIPEEDLDKLFDPFFTTKPEGQGTGLGLSICQGIVGAHGGSIRVENVSGGGAVFIVRLGARAS